MEEFTHLNQVKKIMTGLLELPFICMADEIISGLRIRAVARSTSIAVSAKNKLYPRMGP